VGVGRVVCGDVELAVEVATGGANEARRVSCRPGAEGAEKVASLGLLARVLVKRLLVEEGWAAAGAMRRDIAAAGVLVIWQSLAR